jgi:hypothetical protein
VGLERKQAILDQFFPEALPQSGAGLSAPSAWTCGNPPAQSGGAICPTRGSSTTSLSVLRYVSEANGPGAPARASRRGQGDETPKYVWLYGEEDVPDRHRERFTELIQRQWRKPSLPRPTH